MRFSRYAAAFSFVLLLLACVTAHGAANAGASAAPPAVPPGFADVPAGDLHPGAPLKNIKARSTSPVYASVFQYEEWGRIPKVTLPEYYMMRFECTNAEWKWYLDAEFKTTHTTTGGESLADIAGRNIQFHGKPQPMECWAIYFFNEDAVVKALQRHKLWPEKADPDNPPASIAKVKLPQGIELTYYKHRTPLTWLAWSPFLHYNIGREYCDITKPADQAFLVPKTKRFAALKLRDSDFGDYPVRDISLDEALDFSEWAGCELPSEFEFERAARGDKPNTVLYPMGKNWNRTKNNTWVAWVDNPACRTGPLRVDDPSLEKGVSPFGIWNLLGNVWEVTRTFYDRYPEVTPAPPPDPNGLFNYAFVVKGGSFGDGWQLQQISTRLGVMGHSQPVTLQINNRFDTLGLRLVRHPRPGYDLMLHSILALTYSAPSAKWQHYYPHSFAMPRMGGMDTAHFVEDRKYHVLARKRALGIAVAPLWYTDLTATEMNHDERLWKMGHATGRDYYVLGAFRSDVPFYAGVQLSPHEATELETARKNYPKLLQKYKEALRALKKGQAAPKPPVEPPPPDAFEKATEKNRAQIGVWRRKLVQPGTWLLIYWYGQIGLVNKTELTPPEALLLPASFKRKRGAAATAAAVTPVEGKDEVTIRLDTEVRPGRGHTQHAPGVDQSQYWAYFETLPNGWIGRKVGEHCWEVSFTLPLKEGTLKGHDWNTETK